jgi:trehalose/maltose transport system permease protein
MSQLDTAMSPAAATAHRDYVQTSPRSKTVKKYLGKAGFLLLMTIILVYTLFPFYWAIVSSLKPAGDLFLTPVSYWPETISWSSYEQVFKAEFFRKALWNSIRVGVFTVAIALSIGSLAAYSLGRMKFRGRSAILYIILGLTMFPQIAILASLFKLLNSLGLNNTIWALVISYTTFSLPFTIWVLTGFFRAMPGELEEAALVDGANPMRVFWQILLPLAAPGLVTTGLLAFIGTWNEYLFALTFTQDWGSKTVPLAIVAFSGQSAFEIPWGARLAASLTITLPLIALVMFFQRRIIAGLTAGAVKG